MAAPMLTAARLRELFHYDPDTGKFTSRIDRRRCPAGTEVNGVNAQGYVQVVIDCRHYFGHRLAWLHVFGEWPRQTIDHINGNRADNRIANLRDVPHKTNTQNRRAAQPNTESGLLGVRRNKRRWYSNIIVDGVGHYLGTFDTPQEAHEAYLAAKRRLHPGCTI